MAVTKERSRSRPVAVADLASQLMADSESGMLLVDPAGKLAAINPAAARLLALSPGRALRRPVAGLLRTPIAGEDPLAEDARKGRTERPMMLLTTDGAEAPVLLHVRRIGSPAWRLITLHDQSQARRMREELRRHERLATLGQLAAGVAHEIRNPLAGIGTSAQVLLRRFEPRDERTRFARVILEEVGRLDRIVTGLLQYARPRTPLLAACTLEACVGRVLELQGEALAHAGITVEVDVAKRLGSVYIDADLITQVLHNLAVNGLQAMPRGGRLRFEVRRVRRRPAPRGPGRRASDTARELKRGPATWRTYQQVRVSDTGVGIPRGVLSKLFDPFFSTKPQGTGLGLSISQTIMQEHGGSIEVASREGRGTTVLLNFPVEKRHGERRQPDAHPDAAHAADR